MLPFMLFKFIWLIWLIIGIIGKIYITDINISNDLTVLDYLAQPQASVDSVHLVLIENHHHGHQGKYKTQTRQDRSTASPRSPKSDTTVLVIVFRSGIKKWLIVVKLAASCFRASLRFLYSCPLSFCLFLLNIAIVCFQ